MQAARAVAAALWLAFAAPAAASGLLDDFRSALENEPNWQAAVATRDAGVEAREQGRAQLLPQVSFSGSQGRASTTQELVRGSPQISRDDYVTFNYTLQFRQPIFRLRSLAAFEQGKAQAEYAENSLVAARQDLALRVVGAYAEWAAARGELENADAQVASAEVFLQAAERSLQGGDGTRVDVETARARLEQFRARRTDALGQVQAAILNWRQVTGRSELRAAPTLAAATAERLPLQPSRLVDWQDQAVAASSQVRALEWSVAAAREEVRKSRADHYPTLDAFAARSLSQSDTDVTIGRRFETTRFGLQLNLPIYAGGGIDSAVRQAVANLRRAESELEAGRQKLRLQIERDWHALAGARAGAEAARAAYDAAQLAARAAELGIGAGNATRTDVAQALSQAATARRDLVNAEARALYNWARLMSGADRLDEDGLRAAEGALAATAVARQ